MILIKQPTTVLAHTHTVNMALMVLALTAVPQTRPILIVTIVGGCWITSMTELAGLNAVQEIFRDTLPMEENEHLIVLPKLMKRDWKNATTKIRRDIVTMVT